jgi:hypothetical protein
LRNSSLRSLGTAAGAIATATAATAISASTLRKKNGSAGQRFRRLPATTRRHRAKIPGSEHGRYHRSH